MTRKKLIAGNWKMNLTLSEAMDLAEELVRRIGSVTDVDTAIAPNFTVLYPISEIISKSNIKLSGQNLHEEQKGAFTGETSAKMLTAVGAQMVIIGHSERRKIYGEGDVLINRKITAALAEGLVPIVCVGEDLSQREAGRAEDIVKAQVEGAFSGMDAKTISRTVLAYEPVWAIGTGKTATPDQAQDMHRCIRELLLNSYDKNVANNMRILYGGSVTPDNAHGLMTQPDIDGALVGGASLKADSFEGIVKYQAGA
ncbi:MAG: triose-phosphate isomerase [Deltaproteobacteria bacterium]|nr:triose-phosphate isomerase [Candidatus Zymogenaceae bacterium]